jgi:hypothetical protein
MNIKFLSAIAIVSVMAAAACSSGTSGNGGGGNGTGGGGATGGGGTAGGGTTGGGGTGGASDCDCICNKTMAEGGCSDFCSPSAGTGNNTICSTGTTALTQCTACITSAGAGTGTGCGLSAVPSTTCGQ